jgi:hypothetical protein
MTTTIPIWRQLLWTFDDSMEAHEEWKASCGPHSIAAAAAVSLDTVRQSLSNYHGWMSPTMVTETLTKMGVNFSLTSRLQTQNLCSGINRIQFVGPWLKPGVPTRVAYFHTHWICHFEGLVLCTCCHPSEWMFLDHWKREILEANDGHSWYVTHHYKIDPPAIVCTSNRFQS